MSERCRTGTKRWFAAVLFYWACAGVAVHEYHHEDTWVAPLVLGGFVVPTKLFMKVLQ